jgi:hypothetical protein
MNAAAKASTATLLISSERDARGHQSLVVTVALCPVCLGDRTRHEGGDYPVACNACESRGQNFELRGADAESFLHECWDRDLLSRSEARTFHTLVQAIADAEFAARPFACSRGHRQHLSGPCIVCAEAAVAA